MGQQYSHLSSEERILIEKLHCEQHLSIRRTAERIGRDKSTVSRELRRSLWFASNENGSYRPYRPKRLKTGPWTSGPFYSALAAQRKADRRRRESRKPRRMDSGPLRAWVLDALRRGWSPELIEGRLKAQYAGDPSMRISHECLYQWIYARPQRALDLRQYLPRGKRHRTRVKGRRSKGPRIPMRVPIADRLKKVMSRREFGHFESDTVIGAAPSKRCIDTQVERKSRKLFARLIPDKSALATARAEYDIYPHPRAREDRPHLGQRDRGLLPRARGRIIGHADLLRGPLLLVPEGQQREPQRQDPPLPAQEDQPRRPDGCGPAGHRGRDQRHPHEGPELGNAQRGLVPRARQGNVKTTTTKDGCCTYKLNPGPRRQPHRARHAQTRRTRHPTTNIDDQTHKNSRSSYLIAKKLFLKYLFPFVMSYCTKR